MEMVMRGVFFYFKVVAFTLLTLTVLGCQQNSEPTSITATATATASQAIPNNFAGGLQQKMNEAGIDVKVLNITATGINNLVWVSFDKMPPKFVTLDTMHILDGDLLKLSKGGVEDANNTFLAAIAKDKLNSLSRDDTINFSPANPKATVYVFTDVDCGYCKKFHHGIDDIMAKGIEVRYVAWPRSEETFPLMESVWCSSDRQSAITAAKNGMNVKNPPCANPVKAQYELGSVIGVKGTPAVYNQAGENIGGYMPASELAKRVLP